MKICALQFEPVWGHKETSAKRAETLLSQLQPDEVDFIVLPEMSLSGYVFNSKQEVEPFVERQTGYTFQFCSKHARRLKACIAAGYPEICSEDGHTKYYNSMLVVDENGDLILNYRKQHLFDTDYSWAEKGYEFKCAIIKGIMVSFGICMDINPEDFDSSNDSMRLAQFCIENDVKLLLFSASWLASKDTERSITQKLSDLQAYWICRLTPLIGREVYFVAANRIGLERETLFAGGSCIISLYEPYVVVSAGHSESRLVIATIPDF